jgi:hypothetical protein
MAEASFKKSEKMAAAATFLPDNIPFHIKVSLPVWRSYVSVYTVLWLNFQNIDVKNSLFKVSICLSYLNFARL